MIRDAAYGAPAQRDARVAAREVRRVGGPASSPTAASSTTRSSAGTSSRPTVTWPSSAPSTLTGIELGVRAADRLTAAGTPGVRPRGHAGRREPAAPRGRAAAGALAARLELLPDLGEALMDIGEFAEAGAVLDEAIDAAALIGDAAPSGRSEARAPAPRTPSGRPRGLGEEVHPRDRTREARVRGRQPTTAQLARMWRLRRLRPCDGVPVRRRRQAAEQAIEHARAGRRRPAGGPCGDDWYATAVLHGPTPVDEAIRPLRGDRRARAGVTARPRVSRSAPWHSSRRSEARSTKSASSTSGHERCSRTSAAGLSRPRRRSTLRSSRCSAGDAATAEAELRRDYETLDRLGEQYLLPTVAAMLADVVYARPATTRHWRSA